MSEELKLGKYRRYQCNLQKSQLLRRQSLRFGNCMFPQQNMMKQVMGNRRRTL